MSAPRIHGHRIAGPIPAHIEARHFGIGEATIAAVLAAASIAAGTAGAVISSQQAAATADYNKQVSEQQAELARRAGVAAEADTREKTARLRAEQRAALADTGVTQEGTPLLLLLDSAVQSEVEAQRAKYSGQVNVQASEANARLYGNRASQAQLAGAFGAGTTLLTGATRIAAAYYGTKSGNPTWSGSPSGY